MRPTQTDLNVIKETAGRLGVDPSWLYAVINFESAGTWDPQIKNPHSSARGLIQWMDSTAANMGYKDSLDLVTKHPTIAAQVRGPVFDYLRPLGPFNDEQDFVFSVFLPKYRKSPLETVIYHDDPERMAKFQKANPGIQTVGDYLTKLKAAFVKAQTTLPTWVSVAVGAGMLTAVAGIAFAIRRTL